MKWFIRFLLRLTGQNTFGDGSYLVPEAKAFRYRVGRAKVIPLKDDEAGYQLWTGGNDGFELAFGWDNRTYYTLNQSEVRHLFWWIFWEWFVKSRWLGIRRPIYYWALTKELRVFRKRNR